jgi:uncharacterized protein (DUF1697 family)
MSRLKSLFEELGFDEVETFIASGNVIFSSKAKDSTQLETRIARQLEKSLGYPVDTFVRTAEEVVAIGKAKVFPEEGDHGITVHVGFLHKPLPADAARKLTAVRTKEDEFKVKGRDYYWLCRTRVSQSKVWSSAEMKAVKLPTSSMRNLTSIRKLIAKHFS